MNNKYKAVTWLCLTVMVTAGLKYVPTYLLEQRKLDQQDRVLDIKERVYLQQNKLPTVSLPANAEPSPHTHML